VLAGTGGLLVLQLAFALQDFIDAVGDIERPWAGVQILRDLEDAA